MIGLAVLGTAQATSATNAAGDAARARTLASTATSAVRFVHELEREVTETAALRLRGGKSGVALVTAQRERTDAAATRYLRDSQQALKTAPGLRTPVRTTNDLYGRLGIARVAADNGGAVSLVTDPVYRGLAEALLAIADSVPAQIKDIQLANAARAVAAVASVEHFAALERDLLRTMFIRGTLQPGDLGTLAKVLGARETREAEFRRVATQAQVDLYDTFMHGIDVDNATRMSGGAATADQNVAGLKVDADAWFVAQSGVIRKINLVGLQLSDGLDVSAEQIAVNAQRRAWAIAIGTSSIGIAALVTAIALAVRTARRLRRLRGAALTVARRDLPDAINWVIPGSLPPSVTEVGPSAASVTRGIAATNDEIGQVADAFATVHRTALRLAGEQAELRVDVARMAEVLARRIRTLITRQLRLLDEFERDETDPDVLARLFALDHIAARLRRNGENLLVLSGGEPGRPLTTAVPLAAVITAAASEIEDFHRVESTTTDVAIAGPVVGDIVHLLAELLENAATFSPPTNPVRVDARRTIDGAIVRVHDSGIGIAPPRLAEINSRLVRPAMLTSAAAGTMGLYVVAHLASRHGIRVQLHATGSGTVAYVTLPQRVLEQVSALPAGSRGGLRPEPVAVPSTVGVPIREDAPGGAMLGRPRIPQQRPGASVPAAAPWFRPYLSGGPQPTEQSPWTNQPGAWPPRPGGAPGAAMPMPVIPMPAMPLPAIPMPAIPTAPAAGFGDGSMTEQNLPRRRPMEQLAPDTTEIPVVASPTTAVDPELVRSRLSAFAEGVSAAARRTNSVAPGVASAQKDR